MLQSTSGEALKQADHAVNGGGLRRGTLYLKVTLRGGLAGGAVGHVKGAQRDLKVGLGPP